MEMTKAAAAKLAQARQLRHAGEQQKAVEAYRAALEVGAPETEIHLELGMLHSDLSEHSLAMQHYNVVLSREPQNPEGLCLLGITLLDLRRYEDAARCCRKAIEARPAFPEAHFNLGLAQFESTELDAALRSFSASFSLRRGVPWRGQWPGPGAMPPLSAEDSDISWVKISHDCEQFEYLLAQGRLAAPFAEVLKEYQVVLQTLRTAGSELRPQPLDTRRFPLVASTYKRPLYMAADDPAEGPVVNPDLDWAAIEDRYRSATPSVIAVDSVLTEPGLASLRRFTRESFIWNHLKAGYLGAYFFDGFASATLLRLAVELRERLPRVIGALPLQMMWAYKYENTLDGAGIGLHADAAAVNVNLWITEDEANLAPERGGLLVHDRVAPLEWGFNKINNDMRSIEEYLRSSGKEPLRIPYRANRVAIFDSDLFHATDAPRFRAGYLNRRINITLLYGLRTS